MILALFLLFLSADDPGRRTCKIELTTVDQKAFWWHVHGTDESGLTRLVSIRPGSQTMAALKDCSLFLRGKLPKKPKNHGKH